LNWRFRVLTAEARNRKGQYAAALEILVPEPPSNIPSEILWRRRLAQALSLCQSGKYPQAEERFAQAAALNGEPGALNYARGRCAIVRQELKTAEHFLRLVAAQKSNPDPFLKAYALATLGSLASRDLRYEEAIDLESECLAIVRTVHAPPLEELALGSLGDLYLTLGDLNSGSQNSEAAEKIASQLKDTNQQRWLMNIGHAQAVKGQSGMAEQAFSHALALAHQAGDTDIAAKCLHNLTVVKLDQHQLELAEKYHVQGSKLGLTGENLTNWQVDEAAIIEKQGNYAKAILELQKLLQQVENDDHQRDAVRYRLNWLIQVRLARVYAAQGNRAEAEKWFQRSIATMDAAANTMKHEEFRTSLRDNTPVYDGYVAFLIAQKQYARALHVAQLGRARTLLLGEEKKPTTKPPAADDAQVWLAKIHRYLARDKAVLLSYFETNDECYLWTVTANQLRLSPLGIKGPDLDTLIDSYAQEIQQHLPLASSPAAKKLYGILVQPASDLAPAGSHVIAVADSKLYTINFETLISSQGPDHYWIEDVQLENASSIDLLITSSQKRLPAKGLLLIGAPAQADPHFVELPHAPEEMASVRKHFSPSSIMSFSGHDATPDSYMKSSPGRYKFIHLATHGTPNAIDPLQSAIILSADKGGNFKLLARDIMDRKSRLNADLVTISACQGVGTQIQSLEGLIGLEWAFMRAGAHQVVAALWDQDDAVTPALMDDFYDQLTQGKTATAALRHAKLAMLHAGGFHASPYYWAALQLYTRS
jgi:CHAT domain-containing protein